MVPVGDALERVNHSLKVVLLEGMHGIHGPACWPNDADEIMSISDILKFLFD
jgi:hypothetical protein